MPSNDDKQNPPDDSRNPEPETRGRSVKGYCPVCMGPMPPCKNNRCTNPPE